MDENEYKFLGYKVSKINVEIKEAFYKSRDNSFTQTIALKRILGKEANKFFEIGLKINIGNEDSSLLIEFEIKGGFEANPNMKEDVFAKVSMFNAPSILYPYCRSIISSITAACGISPLNIPLVNFSTIKQGIEEKK